MQSQSQSTARSSPKDCVRWSFGVLKSDPLLVLWKLLADLAGIAVQFGAGLVLVSVLFTDRAFFIESGGTSIAWLTRVTRLLRDPQWIVGFVGLFFIAWLITLFIQSCTYAGIWSGFADALEGRGSPGVQRFLAGLSTSFDRALLQRLTVSLSNISLAVLFLSVALPLFDLTPALRAGFETPILPAASIWALFLTLYAAFSLVVRLAVEFIAPALFVDRVTFGEAILRAADLVARRIVEIYKIVVAAAAFLLIPLFAYWLLVMVQNVILALDVGGGIVALSRLFGDVLLMVCLAGFSLLLHGAFFAFYGGLQMSTKPEQDDVPEAGEGAGRESAAREAIGGLPSDTASLDDLIPDEPRNVVDLDDILAVGESESESPESAAVEPARRADPSDVDDGKEVVEPASEGEDEFDFDALLKNGTEDDDQ